MSISFLHDYTLIVGLPASLIDKNKDKGSAKPAPSALIQKEESEIINDGSSQSGSEDYTTIPSQQVEFKDLKMEATVKYSTGTTGKSIQPTSIKIYNLTEASIKTISRKDASILLKAGYKNSTLNLISVGQIEKVATDWQGPDRVTTILAKDGNNIISTRNYNGKWEKGTTYADGIRLLISEFADGGVPLNLFTENERTAKVLPRAINKNAKLADVLSDVCTSLDYGWYLSLGRLNIHPRESDGVGESIEISRNQVKGSINPYDEKNGKSSFDPESKPQGIKFRTYLNGNISTATTINISFGEFKGTYKVKSLEHRLDSRGDVWDTEVVCLRISK